MEASEQFAKACSGEFFSISRPPDKQQQITDFRPSEGYLINLVARFEMKESEIFDYCILYLSGETNKALKRLPAKNDYQN